MNEREKTIREFIIGSRNRSIRESLACVFVILIFGKDLTKAIPNTAEYFGTLLIVTSAGFICGVVWCFTWTLDMLKTHPESDTDFWVHSFEKQVKLLRTVPLWYVAPLLVGFILQEIPTSTQQNSEFTGTVISMASIAALLVWLNRKAATDLELDMKVFANSTAR